MTSLRALLAFMVVSVVAACAGSGNAHELSGKVTDALSGKGIKGAKVKFTSDTLERESTKTDGSGHYEMVVESDVPFGQVRAEKDGYTPAEVTVFFDTDSRRSDIVMREALPDGGM